MTKDEIRKIVAAIDCLNAAWNQDGMRYDDPCNILRAHSILKSLDLTTRRSPTKKAVQS